MTTVYKRTTLGLLLLLACAAHPAHAQSRLYRYVNEEGVKVLASSIPPQYVAGGYEILDTQGRVVEVVPPAPAPADLARVEAERKMFEEYEILARRYSSVEDILAARDRRLANLDASIAILRGNINNLITQIEELTSKAAGHERAGQAVPKNLLNNLSEVRAELTVTERKLALRQAEHQEIVDRFDQDIDLFERGRKLQPR